MPLFYPLLGFFVTASCFFATSFSLSFPHLLVFLNLFLTLLDLFIVPLLLLVPELFHHLLSLALGDLFHPFSKTVFCLCRGICTSDLVPTARKFIVTFRSFFFL